MENYVRAQSLGGIIRSTLEIYRRNFRVIFLAFLLPNLFLLVTIAVSALVPSPWISIANTILVVLLSFLATVPITVVISDLCLGTEPGVRRAYRRVFGRVVGTVLLALLLTGLTVLIGFLLLVVPGVVFMLWFPFVLVAVVLERLPAIRAMKRSRELGRGYYLRNFGTLIFMNLLATIPAYVLAGIVGGVLGLAGVPPVLIALAGGTIGLILGPIPAIATVLLYYDMRVRKEAYDSIKLAEDLTR